MQLKYVVIFISKTNSNFKGLNPEIMLIQHSFNCFCILDDEDEKRDPKRSPSSTSGTCGSISSASSRISNGGNGVFSPSEFSYSRGFPDTHGLHTLAELCLRRADMEFESQTTKTEFTKEIDSFKARNKTFLNCQ